MRVDAAGLRSLFSAAYLLSCYFGYITTDRSARSSHFFSAIRPLPVLKVPLRLIEVMAR